MRHPRPGIGRAELYIDIPLNKSILRSHGGRPGFPACAIRKVRYSCPGRHRKIRKDLLEHRIAGGLRGKQTLDVLHHEEGGLVHLDDSQVLPQQSGISRARKNGLDCGLESPGCRRIAVDLGRTSKRGKIFVLCGSGLQTLVDFCGSQNEALERVMGIEPTPSAWEAEVLPLNYTRIENRFSGVSRDL